MVVDVKVLIIGSGMAGAGLASALLGRGITEFAVVSAGNIVDPDRAPLPQVEWTSKNSHYWPAPGVAGRIGGRSMLWYGVALRIPDHILAAWPRAVRERLPDAYAHVERHLSQWKGSGLDAPTCAADVALARALPNLGEPFRIVPTAAYWVTGNGQKTWQAYRPIDRVLSSRQEQPVLIDGHRVLWVEEHGRRGFGVVALHEETLKPLTITAERIILAAGTLENTRLFAQSLDRLAGAKMTEWSGLTSKIKHGILARPAQWMTEQYRCGDLAYLVAEAPSVNANLFLELRDDQRNQPYLDLWWFAEQSSDETAHLTFDTRWSVWRGTVHCNLGPKDVEMIRERDTLANDLLRRWGCKQADLEFPALPSKVMAQARLKDRPIRYQNFIGLSDHESGTLPLGKHLDDRFMSHVVDNLFVVGPCAFPRAGATNPSLTILSLAEIITTRLGPDWPGQSTLPD